MPRPLVVLLLALLAASPAVAAQTPGEAAYRAAFARAALGPAADNAQAALAFTLIYRGAVPPAAFAFGRAPDGRVVWNFVGGQPSPEAAAAEALRRCEAAAAPAGAAPCRLLARDGAVEGRAPVAAETTTVGPLRASPLHLRRGPQRAEGVVVWSHGRSGQRLDLRNSSAQGWVSAFNDAGFDVFRFDREPATDEITSAASRLAAAVQDLRAMGYRRVVLVGQSRGGWHSLVVAGQVPALVDAVIAVAPAAHGDSGLGHGAALDDWRRVVTGLPADRVRVAAVLFREDAFDPLPSARIERLEAQAARRSAPTLVISPASGPADHGAGSGWLFTRDWSACLLAFVRDESPRRGTLREGC